MVTGISIPFRVNTYGGIALKDKDDHDAEIISTALADGDNENAFQQDITLGKENVFDVAGHQFRAATVARLKFIFKNFESEKRFKLLSSTIKWEVDDDGNQEMSFRYVNLESDEEKDFQRTFEGS